MSRTAVYERIVKQLLLLLIVLPATNCYNNEAIVQTRCDNSTMKVYVKFSRPFKGIVYTEGNFFNSLCSHSTDPDSTAAESFLNLPFNGCGNKIEETNSGTLISNEIIIQQHRMIQTTFDIIQNITCELPLSFESIRSSFGNSTRNELLKSPIVLSLDLKVGTDLFEVNEVGADGLKPLYLVIKLADRGLNHDLAIRNCIAHDERIISKDTMLYELSDAYGCSNSSMLSNFTITNKTDEFSDLMAYATIKNALIFVKSNLYITCGVIQCKTTCRRQCSAKESQEPQRLTDIVQKMLKRLSETTTSQLELLESKSRSVEKRSVLDDIFGLSRRFLSDIISNITHPLASTEGSTSIYLGRNEKGSKLFEMSSPASNEYLALIRRNVTPDLSAVFRASRLLASKYNLGPNIWIKSTENSISVSPFYLEKIENVSFDAINEASISEIATSVQSVLPDAVPTPISTSDFAILLPSSTESIFLSKTLPMIASSEFSSLLNASTTVHFNSNIDSPSHNVTTEKPFSFKNQGISRNNSASGKIFILGIFCFVLICHLITFCTKKNRREPVAASAMNLKELTK